jgi:transposase-like protein
MQPYHRTNPARRNSKLWKQEIAEAELSHVVGVLSCPKCGCEKDKYYLGSINADSYFMCHTCNRSICVGHLDPRSPVQSPEAARLDSLLLQSKPVSDVRLLPARQEEPPAS